MLRLMVPWPMGGIIELFLFVSIYILMAGRWIPDTAGCDMNHMIAILRKMGKESKTRATAA